MSSDSPSLVLEVASVLQIEELQQKLDALYKSAFSKVQADDIEGGKSEQLASSAAFGKLGREQAKVQPCT